MSHFSLISAIIRGAFLLDSRHAEMFFPLVKKLITGEKVDQLDLQMAEGKPSVKEDKFPLIVSFKDGKTQSLKTKASGGNIFDAAPEGSIAVIPVKGTIMKDDYCGSPGTQTLKAWFEQADNHPNISATVIHADGPGGQVDGTFEFASAIANAKKPVVSFADGLAASATYAIASSAKEVIVSHEAAEIGSIGTMISITDWRKWYESVGAKEHIINATDSVDKNKAYLEALDGKYDSIREQILDPTNDIFLDTVRKNRGERLVEKKNKEPLTGKIYLAKDAIALGLADEIGTFQRAIDRASELSMATQNNSDESSRNQTQFDNMKMKLKAAWGTIIGLLGFTVEGEETKEEFTAEHLEKVNTEMARLKGVETAHEALKTEATQKDATIATLTTDRDNWKQKAEEYGAKAGSEHSSAKKEGTDKLDTDNTIVDMEAEHNKDAMNFLGK